MGDLITTRKDQTGAARDFPDGDLANDQNYGVRDLAKGARTAKIAGFEPVEVIESPGMIRKKELDSEDIFY